MSNERFLHVYGSIRDYAPEEFEGSDIFLEMATTTLNGSGSRVDSRHRAKMLLDISYNASKRIKTIAPHDKADSEEVMSSARQALSEAGCVYIFGYGFDRNNNNRLDLYNLLKQSPIPKVIMFTNKDDRNQINKRASKVFFGIFNSILTHNETVHGDPENYYVEKSIRNVYDALAFDFDDLEAQLLGSTPI
jgi:hypothetical protein